MTFTTKVCAEYSLKLIRFFPFACRIKQNSWIHHFSTYWINICVLWVMTFTNHLPLASRMNHFQIFLPCFILPIPDIHVNLTVKRAYLVIFEVSHIFVFHHMWLGFFLLLSLELRISVNWVVWCLVCSVCIFRKQTLGKCFMFGSWAISHDLFHGSCPRLN